MWLYQVTANAETASRSTPVTENQARGTWTVVGAAATAAVQSVPDAATVTRRASREGRRGEGDAVINQSLKPGRKWKRGFLWQLGVTIGELLITLDSP